jgi:hypothetical protein
MTTTTKGETTMKKATVKLDLGNNEEISQGVNKNSDGTYTAMTFTKSKTFKTRNGAIRWLSRQLSK